MRRWDFEASIIVLSGGDQWLKDSSDFRGENIFISRALGECRPKTALRESEAIMGRSVEISNSAIPCGIDGGAGLIIGNGLVEIAELCAPERKFGQLNS
jgi:hypothetical protein